MSRTVRSSFRLLATVAVAAVGVVAALLASVGPARTAAKTPTSTGAAG